MSCLRYTRDPDACSRDLVAAIDGDEHRGQRLSRGGIRDRAGIEAAQSDISAQAGDGFAGRAIIPADAQSTG